MRELLGIPPSPAGGENPLKHEHTPVGEPFDIDTPEHHIAASLFGFLDSSDPYDVTVLSARVVECMETARRPIHTHHTSEFSFETSLPLIQARTVHIGQNCEILARKLRPAEWPEAYDKLMKAIDSDNPEKLRLCGIDALAAWPADIVARLARREPLAVHAIEAEVDIPNSHIDPTTTPPEAQGDEIYRLFRYILEQDSLTTSSLPVLAAIGLHDLTKANDEQPGYRARRIQHASALVQSLQLSDTLDPTSRSGYDHVVYYDSSLNHRVRRLDKFLRCGRSVTVENGEERGAVFFRFLDHDFVRRAAPERLEVLMRTGIKLRETDGTPTKLALLVARLASPDNLQHMHLMIADEQDRQIYEDARLLLSTISPEYNILFRPLFIDRERIPSELVPYALARILERASLELNIALESYSHVSHMTQEEVEIYTDGNYGEGVVGTSEYDILPEDVDIIKILAPVLPLLFPRGIESLAIPAHGAYSYLAQLAAALLRKGAVIEATDVSFPSLTMANSIKDSTLSPAMLNDILRKFERLAIAAGGEKYGKLYQGCADKLREKLSVDFASMDGLKGRYHAIFDPFGRGSIMWSKTDFWRGVANDATHLDDTRADNVLIALHMVGSTGWNRRFPSVNLTIEEITQAYRDAGLHVRVHSINTDVKARHGYKAMAVVIARAAPFTALMDHLGTAVWADTRRTDLRNTLVG